MRILIAALVLTACSAHSSGGTWGDLSGGEGGTGREYTPPPKPDLGLGQVEDWPEVLDLPPENSCDGLDFLFVIDNSTSMENEQEKFTEAVPKFVEHLKAVGLASQVGMHVGVITTDSYTWNEEGCQSLGALVTQTGQEFEDPVVCGPYQSGKRFMTEEDDLDDAFTCTALVGAKGSADERPIDAIIQALDDWHNRPTGCNEGFLRTPTTDDSGVVSSKLVIVILTDEDDVKSADEPALWVEHLSVVRGTDLSDLIVVLIIPGAEDCDEAPRLNEFAELLPNSHVASICDEEFSSVLADAAFLVKEQCGVAVPPEQ